MNSARKIWSVVPLLACLLLASGASVHASGPRRSGDDSRSKTPGLTLSLESMDGLEVQGINDESAEPVKFEAAVASYRGRRAVRIVNIERPETKTGEQVLAIVKTSDFKDGTIEVDVAGTPREGAKPSTRGFVGIAFRIQEHAQEHGSHYEAFYLRMTNGRAGDQLQRNHSSQYVSQPDFPWQRLRDENPGMYESYVDLEAGAWTRIKIVVSGTKAQLYVNNAEQPCLIVNDLKLGEIHGPVALWTGSDTEAYFSNLTIR
jgi:3-keto-disaccharide hydrolase